MACVYIHKTPDGKIFYVGIGITTKRAYHKYGSTRTKYWQNVVAKHGYTVEILFDNISRQEACQIETYLIFYYGRRCIGTGNLVNFKTFDRKGAGYKLTKDTCRKMSLNNAKTKSKKVIDSSTGKIYNCLLDYTKEKGMKYGGIRAKLNGQNPNNTTLKYL